MKIMTMFAAAFALVACSPVELRNFAEAAEIPDGGAADGGVTGVPETVQGTPDGGPADGGVNNTPLATCADGLKNGNESDVDCGGNVCNPCVIDRMCAASSDCQSGRCNTGICQASSNTNPTGNVGITTSERVNGNVVTVSWTTTGLTSVNDVKVWWGSNSSNLMYYEVGGASASGEKSFQVDYVATIHYYQVVVSGDGKSVASMVRTFGGQTAVSMPVTDQFRLGGSVCDSPSQCASKICDRLVCGAVSGSPYPPDSIGVHCRQARDTCEVRVWNPYFVGFYELQPSGMTTFSADSAQDHVVLLKKSVICSSSAFIMAPDKGELLLYNGYQSSPRDVHPSYAEVVRDDGVKIWGNWSQANGGLAAVPRSFICP